MTNRRLTLLSFVPVALALACPTKEVPDDAGAIDAAEDAASVDATGATDGAETWPKLPPPSPKELGVPCSRAADCGSGFCVDAVCCDSGCDGACSACDRPGLAGHCAALDGVEDLSATSPCAGTRICAKDAAGNGICLLTDGEACLQSSDCVSGSCRAYYLDQDADGYGVDGADTIRRCEVVARPPQGFTTVAGDCCDSDPGAHPGVSAYFTTRQACGSFDWNCSGAEERPTTGACPTASAVLACGQLCTFVLKGTASTVFVQSCH